MLPMRLIRVVLRSLAGHRPRLVVRLIPTVCGLMILGSFMTNSYEGTVEQEAGLTFATIGTGFLRSTIFGKMYT